jgi:hypothetical protein
MTDNEEGSTQSDKTPNFELPFHGVIREDNWAEYEARGFRPVYNTLGEPVSFSFAQGTYGIEHIYTGHPYDDEAQRPLRHKGGVGLYTDPEGLEVAAENRRKWAEFHRQREGRQRSEGGPGAN